QLGAFAAARGKAEGAELEGHGDVAAACAFGSEAAHRSLEGIEWTQQAPVIDALTGGLRELRVDEGRLAVFDRVAGDDVAVGGRRRGADHLVPAGSLLSVA